MTHVQVAITSSGTKRSGYMSTLAFIIFTAVVLYLAAVALLIFLSFVSPSLREIVQRTVEQYENDH